MENIVNFGEMQFNLPKNQSNVIKVIGVGGGGSNAVNHMYKKGIEGVDFVICNTDAQALNSSPVPIKIQLGASLTEGLGAGANPDVGMQSALESRDDIETMLGVKTKMVFITVGMGGGTGTGAAPIIAKIAKDMGLLTVAIVTTPFAFEGKTRNDQAQNGIKELREFVDSIIVINNNKLREVYGNLGFKSGFSKADEVLSTAAMGITNVITNHYTQNIDFRDANTVLANSGSAIMGSAKAEGVNRAQDAITKALDSPLLNDNKITGAKNVLLLIVSGINEITIDEIGEINDYIQSEAKTNVNIIMGVGEDVDLGDSIEVTIVATGFDKKQQSQISTIESKKIVYNLDDSSKVVKKETLVVPKKNTNNIDKPVNKEPKIVHQLDKDLTTPLTLFDITDVESTSSKNIIDKDEVSKEKGFLGNDFLDLLSDVKNELTLVNEVTENKTEE
ncbi:MAG TPA: cell division protein FtsZ, partial [Flavobacteriaceae bacterium]|nr:cell division protein FtsZ [Flavobacteriaceae bacterium]